MRKVFDVELSSENGCTQVTLPAAPWSMQDALEKLCLKEGETPRWDILRTHSCDNLYPYLDQAGTLFELNALCQQLSLLNEPQTAIVEGLIKAEFDQGTRPVPLPQIIDMAYSTDRCHLLDDITTDVQLGRFCAENSFVPETEDLSDAAFELLDFAKIGREFRQNEGGVFTSGGYVQRHDELRQVYQTLDLTPKKPDYVILAELPDGSQIKLPVPLGDPTGDEPVLCVDCAAPALTGLSGTMATLDMLARRLSELEADGELTKYKAALTASGCDDVGWALELADDLGQYMLDPQCRTPEEVAEGAISLMVPRREIALLRPSVNLHQYGQDIIRAGGGQLTGCGLIARVDGQPVHGISQEPSQGGMEMK